MRKVKEMMSDDNKSEMMNTNAIHKFYHYIFDFEHLPHLYYNLPN